MPGVRVHIYGEGSAAAKATALIRAGDGELKDRLYGAIRRANQGVETELRRSALRHLPKTNGLAREVSTARITIRSNFASGAGAYEGVGITISAWHEYHLRGLDRGMNVHPLFGNRRHWYTQAVRPGWWSSVMREQVPATKAAIERATKAYYKSRGL